MDLDSLKISENDQLMKIGAELLLKTVVEINKNFIKGTELNFISQNDENTYHAPKITKELCKINWNKSGDEIYNLIRGLSPYPTAMAYLNNGDDKQSIIKIYNSPEEPNPLLARIVFCKSVTS